MTDTIEETAAFRPHFDAQGLIVCVTADHATSDVLMVAYMNAEALQLTLDSGIVHYWSRSRQKIWRKGDTSGQVQRVKDIRTDCDQDSLLLTVETGGDGGACHTGRRSCFYRRMVAGESGTRLVVVES